MHIYLNAATGLLYQLETRGARPEDFSWAMWGGVVEQTTYYYWVQESNGVAFPRQWDISRNGLPYKSRMVTDLEFNPDMPSDSFAIDDDVRTAFKARLDGGNPPVQEVARPAPGIVAFQTWFRVVVAEQKDGVVIIDAPVSPELSQAVIDTVRSRYPGKPIKAAIIAAGAWTQFGGVAAFAQEGIPVYGPAYNADIFERFVTSRIGDTPWRFVPVEEPVRIGTGDEAVVVFPTGGSNTRGALLTLFPGHRLLYASSMVVPPGGSKASSWSLQEIRESIHRNGFDVENYFSMFLGVTPWNPVESSDN